MKEIAVKLVKSRIGSTPHQKKMLDALGLRKLNKVKVFKDTPSIRGIIAKVPHLVKIVDVLRKEK